MFLSKLQKALTILAPIDQLIVKYQSDKVPVSEVIPDFAYIETSYEQLLIKGTISYEENIYLKKVTCSCYLFLFGDAHVIANLLDPRFLGKDLNAELKELAENILFEPPLTDETPSTKETQQTIVGQFNKFFIAARRSQQANTFRYQMLEKKTMSPLECWEVEGCQWPDLQNIAITLFSLATSSASIQRNFSTYGFIHLKQRNRLSTKSAEKLVFIKSNLKSALFKGTAPSSSTPDTSKTSQSTNSDGNSPDVSCDDDYDEEVDADGSSACGDDDRV